MAYNDGKSINAGFRPEQSRDSSTEVNPIEVLRLVGRYKAFVATTIILCSLIAYFNTVISRSYSAQLSLLVQKAENSALQGVASEFGGAARTSYFGVRDTLVEKYLTYLQTRDFANEAALSIYPQMKLEEMKPALQSKNYRYLKGVRGIFGKILPEKSKLLTQIDRKLANQPTPKMGREDFARFLRSTMSFSKAGLSGITLSVVTPDPELSVKLANLIGSAAVEILNRRETKELDEAKAYLKAKIKEEKAELDEVKTRMLELRRKFVVRGGGSSEESAKRIDRFLSEVESSRLKIDENRRMIEILSEGTNRSAVRNSTSGAGGAEEYSESIRRQLSALIERRGRMLAEGLSSKSKKVREIDNEIRKTSEKIKMVMGIGIRQTPAEGGEIFSGDLDLKTKLENLARENVLLSTKIESGSKMVEKLREGQRGLPEFEQTYLDLTKAIDIQYQQYLQLTRQIFQVEMQRISVQNRISIVERASADSVFTTPTLKSKVITANIMGIGFLLFILLSLDRVFPKVRGQKDLQALGVPYFGSIPDFSRANMLRRRRTHLSEYLINHNLDSPESIAFKHLKQKLMTLNPANNRRAIRIISIHSSLPNEGKTFVSLNFAASLAASGKKVVVVDGDMRAHALTDVFVRHSTVGLSSILAHNDPVDYVLISNTGIANLHLIPSGKFYNQATELLASVTYPRLLQQLLSRYDYVVIDTPPTLPIPDSSIIASQSDLVLLSTKASSSRLDDVANSLDRLSTSAQGSLYTLLNKAPYSSSSYYYYGKRNNLRTVENVTINTVAQVAPLNAPTPTSAPVQQTNTQTLVAPPTAPVVHPATDAPKVAVAESPPFKPISSSSEAPSLKVVDADFPLSPKTKKDDGSNAA